MDWIKGCYSKWFWLLCLLSMPAFTAPIDSYFESLKKNPQALYTFLNKMPKGGELHTHFDGSANVDKLLFLAQRHDYCLNLTTFTLSAFNKNCIGVNTREYLKNHQHRETLRKAWSVEGISPDDPTRYNHFFAIFSRVAPLYSDFTIPLLKNMIQEAARQHVLYLEVLMLHTPETEALAQSIANLPSLVEKKQKLLANPLVETQIAHQVQLADQYLPKVHQALGCKHSRDPACEVTVKFQYYVLREKPIDEVFAQALIGFAAASRTNSIVGVNLVQPEKGPIAARDILQQMRIFAFLHQAYPEVTISMHAGELPPEFAANHADFQNHIQNSVQIGLANRIGHGADLLTEENYPKLLQTMHKRGIAVEINLTSNQDILLLKDEKHPFMTYLKANVPIVLSTDDAGISETDLSEEFLKATLRYHLDYQTIQQINRNALTYSFLKGKSIWLNPTKRIPVAECHDLQSKLCHQFIAHSQKAQLQWTLENKLAAFEADWNIHHESSTNGH